MERFDDEEAVEEHLGESNSQTAQAMVKMLRRKFVPMGGGRDAASVLICSDGKAPWLHIP